MQESPNEITPKDRFLQSLERCASSDQFVLTFYERFMASSEDVRRKFLFTSLETQSNKLLESLRLSAGATNGESEALAELRARAETHNRHHLDIKPELYDLWLDSLVDTAREFDHEWSDSIESAWRTILGFVIHRMTAKY